jgi:hypothetical protein
MIHERPTPIATPTSPMASATHQSCEEKPLATLATVRTTGMRTPAKTNEGMPSSRPCMIRTSPSASRRTRRSILRSGERSDASISRAQYRLRMDVTADLTYETTM